MFHRLLYCLPLAAFLCLPGGAAQAEEQGPYRSKILISPEGDWARGAELSVRELEQQLGSIEEAYAKSSAGRHLARHYVERAEYDKAIAFYQDALAAEGLSSIANREMLREMAQVYLLKKDYAAAHASLKQALSSDLVPEVTDFLLLARTQHELGQYAQVVASLDRVQQNGLTLNRAQTEQALALYYHAGAFVQCELLLTDLIDQQPDEPRHWHLLASVFLQQNKKKQALDQLALAREKQVPFSESDLLLLANLYANNGNPYSAAETLEAALAAEEVPATGSNYRKLFEFWLQAREQDQARSALQQAARLSGEIELYLHLAQLQMEQEDFKGMHKTMLAACESQLDDKFVGRANLLMGISQLKLGDDVGARRSFINATLIGGANAQAGQWLGFMQALPPTPAETRRIAGICHGPQDKRLRAGDQGSQVIGGTASEAPDKAGDEEQFATKTVPSMRLYSGRFEQPLMDLVASLRATVVNLATNLVKSGGRVEGPLQLIFSRDSAWEKGGVGLQLGLPTDGGASGSGRFRIMTTAPFKCAYRSIEQSPEGLLAALSEMAEAVRRANYETTGEARIVIPASDNAQGSGFELQIGIR